MFNAARQMKNPQNELRNFLREELTRSRLKNPRFSLRAFSRKVGVTPSAVSEVLSGRRRMTRLMTDRITKRLATDPMYRARLLALFEKKREHVVPQERVLVENDQFHAIASWYHFAILSLAETQEFQSDAEWIGRRLGITAHVAQQAIDRLIRLGMLLKTETGSLKATGAMYRTSDEIKNLSQQSAHAVNLDLARESLENDSIDFRDFTAMTMAIDPLQIPSAKQCVRRFLEEMCSILEQGDRTEVYKLNVQLFPLTKLSKNKPSKDPV